MVQIPGEKWGLQIKERDSRELHNHKKTLSYQYQIFIKGQLDYIVHTCSC